MRINGPKYIFHIKEMEFLGYIISLDGIKIDSKKVSHWLSEDAQIPWHAPPKQPDSGTTLFITLHHTRSTTFPTEITHSY
jgi:hypothetical protein